MTPAQLRAARALMGWSRRQLNETSAVSVETIKNIEKARNRPAPVTLGKLVRTFAAHNVAFVGSGNFEGVIRVQPGRGPDWSGNAPSETSN